MKDKSQHKVYEAERAVLNAASDLEVALGKMRGQSHSPRIVSLLNDAGKKQDELCVAVQSLRKVRNGNEG